MKLGQYLKEKGIYLLSMGGVTLLSGLLLYAFLPETVPALPLLVGSLLMMGWAIPLAREYFIKKHFYDRLLNLYDSLDQKNLISEMISPPGFIEGNILAEILHGCNKAMLEKIRTYKHLQEEYREYIELWVHEIKTPISSSRLIAQNNESEVMESLSEELSKIDGLVEQVLYHSRSNNVEKDYLIREISLKKICYDSLRKNARLFIQNKVSVVLDALEDHTVYSDNKWLEFILGQIFTNSVKYADKSAAWIKLEAKKEANCILLTIKDNGSGIRDNELGKIFDKGFTGTNGRANERSTGMGLYICKKLCDKLGMGIEAQSVWGEGTALRLIFPVNSMLIDSLGD